jgi:hypothetical protein
VGRLANADRLAQLLTGIKCPTPPKTRRPLTTRSITSSGTRIIRSSEPLRSKSRSVEKKQEWDEFKASLECRHCGMSGRPEVIDFHHTDKDNPNNEKVHKFVGQNNYTAAMREVRERCIPLCSNCHRIHHAKEFPKNQGVLDDQ